MRAWTRLRHWQEQNYVSVVPVLGPGSAGKFMELSPVVAAGTFFSSLFSKDSEGKRGGDERFVARDDLGAEELVYGVGDDIDIVIRSYNQGITLEELAPHELLSLIETAIRQSLSADELDQVTRFRG